MPRLPDRTALGDPGSYRSGRAWLNANDVDASAIGKGLRSAGGALTEIGADMRKEAEAEGLMAAELHKAKYGAELERSFDNDPNYNTYSMRFKTGVDPINKDAAQLIPNSKMRQKWLEKAQLADINQHDALMKRANAMDKEKKFVGVQTKLDELSNLYTETGEDDDKRLQHQKDLKAFIDTAVMGGVADPSQGKALEDKYLKGAQLSYANTLLAKDPKKLIQELDALPNYRPQEGLPDAKIEPRKDGLSTITAPKSGAKVHVSGEYADRFAGFIKDLEEAGVEIKGDQTGGYANRNIRGTNTKSRHAHGEAVDINWTDNPQGDGSGGALSKQIGADKVRELAKKHGLKWGGDFKTAKPDPMHFEVDTNAKIEKPVQVADAGNVISDASPERTRAEQFLGRLSPEQRAELRLQAKSKKTELDKGAYFSIKNQLEGVKQSIEKTGGMPADFDLSSATQTLVDMGKEAEANDLIQDVKKADAAYKAGFTEVGDTRSPLSWSTSGEMQAHLDALSKPKKGEDGEAFAIREYAYDKTAAKVKAIEDARVKDPAQLVEGDPEQGWDAHPAIKSVQDQIYKLKLSESGSGQIVLDDRTANIMLANARIQAQQDIGIPTDAISPITRKQEKELLNIPNPSMVQPGNAMELFEERLNGFKAQLGDEIGTLAFKSAVEHFVKDGDLKEIAGAVIPDIVSGRIPSYDAGRRMREATDLANFNRLMNGGTASGMQALPKPQSSRALLAAPTEFKGAMSRAPTDLEIEGLKKFPGRRVMFDQMYGPGAAAAALSSQSQPAQATK